MDLKRGQKIAIEPVDSCTLTVEWSTPKKAMDVDVSAFLLDANNRCVRDEHFIFYGQPQSPNQSVQYRKQTEQDGTIEVLLNQVPQDVERIAITLTIHEGDTQNLRFEQIDKIHLTVGNRHHYHFGEDLQQETAIVVGELYRHNGAWKLNVIGSGFNGGLQALCEHYGLEITDTPQEPLEKSAPVKLEKMNVNLEKRQSVSIAKSEKFIATLEWANPKKDLDLYCFYVLANGETGKVYYRDMGNASKAPYITLDGDSKTAGQETIIIHQPSKISYVLIAAYSAVSNGFGSFKKMKAQAVVDNQLGQRVTSGLFEKNNFAYWVAIAHIDLSETSNARVSHVEKYSKSGSERSPALYTDGTFEMDKGPVEFK